jgi:hypothetical protein
MKRKKAAQKREAYKIIEDYVHTIAPFLRFSFWATFSLCIKRKSRKRKGLHL